MTDQEFLSQNLDVLLQDLWFPSIVKDIMFSENLIPTTIKIAFGIFFIISLIYFYKFSPKTDEKANISNAHSPTRQGNYFIGSFLASLLSSTMLTASMYFFSLFNFCL